MFYLASNFMSHFQLYVVFTLDLHLVYQNSALYNFIGLNVVKIVYCMNDAFRAKIARVKFKFPVLC